MKITEYVKYDQHRTYLYEGLDSYAINEARDWERILRPIVEAQLTPDQINTLFQQAQQIATDAGGNRTGIGKGVDYVAAKAEAWEKIKTALQNTGPISGFEAQYDKLAEKIKEKTGGDQGIMKYIQMYRDLATKYPKTQKVVYGVAIAGVGILALGGSVAAMSGGPVILGLLKMTDRLLQGDKLTSAIWQGVKTGALAAVGVGVGKGIRNMLGFGAGAGGGAADAATDAAGAGKLTAKAAVDQLKQKFLSGEIKDYPSYQNALRDVFSKGSITGQMSLDMSNVSSQLEKQLGITFKGQYPDAVTDAGAKLMKQAGVQDMTGPGRLDNIPKAGTDEFGKTSTGETPAQQAARYAKNDVGNTPGQQATKDALRAGNAANAAQPQGGPPKSLAPKFVATAAAKAGVDPDEADFGMRHPGVDAKADLAAGKANLDTPDGVKAASSGPSAAGTAPTTGGAANTSAAIDNAADKALAGVKINPGDIQGASKSIDSIIKNMVKDGTITDHASYSHAMTKLSQLVPGPNNLLLQTQLEVGNKLPSWKGGVKPDIFNKWIQSNGGTPSLSGYSQEISDPEYMKKQMAAFKASGGRTGGGFDDYEESVYEARLREELSINRKLPKSQITEMFRQVDEGVWDTVKKGVGAAAGAVASGASAVAGSRIGQAVGATAKDAAGAVAQKVGTVATNLTTKVTTDKLMKAWKAAGSPTDSVEVYYLMKNQGLDDATLTNIFKAAKVRTPVKGAKTPAATPPAAGGTPPATPPQAPAAGGKQLSQTPGAVRKRNARAAAKAPPAPAAPAPAASKGFNVNLRQTPAQKNAMALTKAARGLAEEGENDVPLDKAAINKIFMSIAQAGAGGSSPQQQAPAAGNTAPQQGSGAQAAPDDEQQPAQGSRAPAQKSNGSPAAPAGGGSAPASGSGYTGPDVPLNKAAINKILMAVAQAGA